MENLKELEKALKAPMDYKWRIQSISDRGAVCVAYVDARDVMDRLDEVFGIGGWSDKYYQADNKLFCEISALGISKTDTGSESNVEADKGLVSDAFKRAAVKWGIGRFLYSLGMVTLKAKRHTNGKNYPADNLGNILWSSEDLNNYIKTLKR